MLDAVLAYFVHHMPAGSDPVKTLVECVVRIFGRVGVEQVFAVMKRCRIEFELGKQCVGKINLRTDFTAMVAAVFGLDDFALKYHGNAAVVGFVEAPVARRIVAVIGHKYK